MLLAHETHGFGEVAVVAHHHPAPVCIEPAVVQEMHGEIDVGSLLLCLDHLRRPSAPQRLRQRYSDPVPEKVPLIHLLFRAEALECTEIDVLPLRLGLVGRGTGDSCGEVLDLEDVMMLLQDHFEQSNQVQPLPWGSLDSAIVEIETVHIHKGTHVRPPQKARASEEAPRPAVETARGVLRNMAEPGNEV